MVTDVANRSGYGREKANQSDDVDTSQRVQETNGDCQGYVSLGGRANPTRTTDHCSPVLCSIWVGGPVSLIVA
jgi:hypothetical protein